MRKTYTVDCRTMTEPLLPSEETKNVGDILPAEFGRRTLEHYCVNEWAVHLDDVMNSLLAVQQC